MWKMKQKQICFSNHAVKTVTFTLAGSSADYFRLNNSNETDCRAFNEEKYQ